MHYVKVIRHFYVACQHSIVFIVISRAIKHAVAKLRNKLHVDSPRKQSFFLKNENEAKKMALFIY